MKLYGYRDWDWEPDYVATLPNRFVGSPSVEPTILDRAGAFATFGLSRIGETVIPVGFLYQGTALFIEDAFVYLSKRLQLYNDIPGQLRAELNNGNKVSTRAVIRYYGGSSFGAEENEVDVFTLEFVAVAPWEALVASTASGTF